MGLKPQIDTKAAFKFLVDGIRIKHGKERSQVKCFRQVSSDGMAKRLTRF